MRFKKIVKTPLLALVFSIASSLAIAGGTSSPTSSPSNSPVAQADLSLSLSGIVRDQNNGGSSFFYVSVHNREGSTAQNVKVKFPFCEPDADGHVYLGSQGLPNELIYNCDNGELIIGTVAVGETVSRKIPFYFLENFAGWHEVVAQISASSLPDPDSQVGNWNASEDDQASMLVTRDGITYPTSGLPELVITTIPSMIHQDVQTVVPNFTIVVTNIGDLPATSVTLEKKYIGNVGQEGYSNADPLINFLPVVLPMPQSWPPELWNIFQLNPGESRAINAGLLLNFVGSKDFQLYVTGVMDGKSTNNIQALSVTGNYGACSGGELPNPTCYYTPGQSPGQSPGHDNF